MKPFLMEKNRSKIFQQFLYSERLRFSEILRKSRIPSNLLAYFLKKMLAEGILEHSKGFYKLSKDYEKLIPFFALEPKSVNPLVVLLIACVKEGKVLLAKREKRPFRNFWSLPSSRLLQSESIKESCERIMREKYLQSVQFQKTNSVVFERLVEKQQSKHGFVFFFCSVLPLEEFKESAGLKWFLISKLPKRNVIASDYWLVKNRLNSKAEVVEELIQETAKTTRMQLL